MLKELSEYITLELKILSTKEYKDYNALVEEYINMYTNNLKYKFNDLDYNILVLNKLTSKYTTSTSSK